MLSDQVSQFRWTICSELQSTRTAISPMWLNRAHMLKTCMAVRSRFLLVSEPQSSDGVPDRISCTSKSPYWWSLTCDCQLQGRCNADPQQRSVTVMITDSCPECEADHLDIQALTYNKVSPEVMPKACSGVPACKGYIQCSDAGLVCMPKLAGICCCMFRMWTGTISA